LRMCRGAWQFRDRDEALVWRLTFELSGCQRQDARPGPVKMHRVPPARAWWPAVGAPLERGVRLQWARQGSEMHSHAGHCASRSALRQEQSRYSASAAPAAVFAWRLAPCSNDQGLHFQLFWRADTQGDCLELTHPFNSLIVATPDWSGLLLPIAASGGFLVSLDWRALTPALTQIRLFTLATWLVSAQHCASSGAKVSGLASSWLFSSRRQAHFLLEQRTWVFLKPNVRAKLAPTVGRAGQVGENVQGTADLARVARRWGSTWASCNSTYAVLSSFARFVWREPSRLHTERLRSQCVVFEWVTDHSNLAQRHAQCNLDSLPELGLVLLEAKVHEAEDSVEVMAQVAALKCSADVLVVRYDCIGCDAKRDCSMQLR